MIIVTFSKIVNIKWLTKELLAAGVNVSTVTETYVEIAEIDQALALTVIEAHNPLTTPDILEKADLSSLNDDITTQITWMDNTIPEIDNGIANVTAFTNATQRAIVTGLLENQKRVLQIIKGILKAFRYIVRRLL